MAMFAAVRTEVTVAQIEAQDRRSAMILAQRLPDSAFEHDEELGSLDIEYLEDGDSKYTGAPCTENCTSCIDTTCIFHETNRGTDECKEMSCELRRSIAEV